MEMRRRIYRQLGKNSDDGVVTRRNFIGLARFFLPGDMVIGKDAALTWGEFGALWNY
jgi:hypothetical protein